MDVFLSILRVFSLFISPPFFFSSPPHVHLFRPAPSSPPPSPNLHLLFSSTPLPSNFSLPTELVEPLLAAISQSLEVYYVALLYSDLLHESFITIYTAHCSIQICCGFILGLSHELLLSMCRSRRNNIKRKESPSSCCWHCQSGRNKKAKKTHNSIKVSFVIGGCDFFGFPFVVS